MNNQMERGLQLDSQRKASGGHEHFPSPVNAPRKGPKARLAPGGFYTPGNLKAHYMNRQRQSGGHQELER